MVKSIGRPRVNIRGCKVNGCDVEQYAKNLCKHHYIVKWHAKKVLGTEQDKRAHRETFMGDKPSTYL